MMKIYTEKIHQSTRFGLIDEDGRKPLAGRCGQTHSGGRSNA